ncbi:MAG: peptidylprolyl isomerase [Candidatus Omnitrophica bacterium]|nr:peptidylprolyl isomerase [Candidatus Omnitrophota bacterium]
MKNIVFYFLCLILAGCSSAPKTNVESAVQDQAAVTQSSEIPTQKETQIVNVKIETTLGTIEAELYPEEAPKTVENFVTLAKKGFYDGIIFHRVVPQFMIQTGDPTGTGTGGPGYQFRDEFSPKLRHDQAGVVSMANAGSNTNGSQFFITVAPTPWLDNRHSIFGRVTQGMEVVQKISEAPRDRRDKPLEQIQMTKVTIL